MSNATVSTIATKIRAMKNKVKTMKNKVTKNKTKQNKVMDGYAESHYTLTTSIQAALYDEADQHMTGQVLDICCGTGKMAAYTAFNSKVKGYTGIDNSATMLAKSNLVLDKVDRSEFKVKQCDINDFESDILFDSGVCLMGYQFLEDQQATLDHASTLFRKGATFVVASANEHQDLPALGRLIQKEQIGHPHLDAFFASNQALEGEATLFADMKTMQGHLEKAGFEVIESHDRHYQGGVNFIVARKI